jgi:hypothetical protein
MADRARALVPELPERVGPAAQQARRLFPNAQFWTWRYALLPIAAAASLLIVAGIEVSWGLVIVEALAVILALTAWSLARSYRPGVSGLGSLILSGVLLVLAAVGAVILAQHATLVIPLGIVAVALLALNLLPIYTSIQVPDIVKLPARLALAPALIGIGLFVITASAQSARMTTAMWLLGLVMSLLACAAELANVMASETSVEQGSSRWLRAWPLLALALLLSGAAVVWVALPLGEPHGVLLALLALPTALVAVSGLAHSTYLPARTWAARRIGAIYTYVGLAITVGALASFAVGAAVDALTRSLGF